MRENSEVVIIYPDPMDGVSEKQWQETPSWENGKIDGKSGPLIYMDFSDF